ncbi:unnamed protein product [Rotaria sp. Silwood2]|nr:unnamed protein product [Rotaria sp. Silwood2]CAF3028605.1 unnamed protein product [Rotaria sp. Silwood2]CAF3300203.1 unnamed protein product [Rotaria sp. Silwood2]CAF4629989.1 unnamed protein product [Rotaria sp. Silwood2]CAF4784150.1 unnamed protein product [Rotaria sp. Silwood2]
MYKNPNNGNNVDLSSITGVKQKMKLYVTSLIDIILHVTNYSNLMQQNKNSLIYCLSHLLEAVRNIFRLSDDIFNIEWCNLHKTFLNKLQNTRKGLKTQRTTVQTNPSAQS